MLEGGGKPAPETGLEPAPKRIRLLSYGTGRGGARGKSAYRGGGRGATGVADTAAEEDATNIAVRSSVWWGDGGLVLLTGAHQSLPHPPPINK